MWEDYDIQKDDRRGQKFKKSKAFLEKHPNRRKKRDHQKQRTSELHTSTFTKTQWIEFAEETVQAFSELPEDSVTSTIYYPEEKDITIDDENIIFDTKFAYSNTSVVEMMHKDPDACYLIFMSAKNPGGGFLKGSVAQEESIACHTSLYKSLTEGDCSVMYERNTSLTKIPDKYAYRSDVIFFDKLYLMREYEGGFLSEYVPIQGVGSPAVNWVHFSDHGTLPEYVAIMRNRIDRIVRVCVANNVTKLVLGPWGCGVFGGDLHFVTHEFKNHPLIHHFEHIRFISQNDDELDTMKKS